MCPTNFPTKIPTKKSFFGTGIRFFSRTFRDAIFIISIFGMHTFFGVFGFFVVGHFVSSFVSDTTMSNNHATNIFLFTPRTLFHFSGQPC